MATIRVYLLTYRRPHLLRRALAGLLAQSFTDWVCELHNDAPGDDAPRLVLAELAPADPRISYHPHPVGWGINRVFNHCLGTVAEPYATILEDDNWWDPELLESLLRALAANPDVGLAWANMKIWQEHADGSWTDTGNTIWPVRAGALRFEFPVLLQAFDSLHSNGAMLFRTALGPAAVVPASTPSVFMESARERALPAPLLLLREPLGHFALTLSTGRSQDRRQWVEVKLLEAASFLEGIPLTEAAWDDLWARCRAAHPPRTSLLLLVGLAGVRRREIFARAGGRDWLRLVRSLLGSPRANLLGLRFRRTYPEVWAFLVRKTAERAAEARRRGWVGIEAGSLFERRDLGPSRPSVPSSLE